MKYSNKLFDKFNIVEFNGVKTRDFIQGYDIENLTNKGDFFVEYAIEGNPNLDTLSYKIYGDVSYYWVIILVNNIQDAFFDLPMSQEELKVLSKTQLEDEAKSLGITNIKEHVANNFYTRFLLNEEENNNKRIIKIVRPETLPKFLNLLKQA